MFLFLLYFKVCFFSSLLRICIRNVLCFSFLNFSSFSDCCFFNIHICIYVHFIINRFFIIHLCCLVLLLRSVSLFLFYFSYILFLYAGTHLIFLLLLIPHFIFFYIKEKPNLCQQFIIDDFIHTLDSSLHHLLLILLVRLIIIVIIAVVIIITFKIVVAGWDTDAELNAECLKCLKDFVIIIIFLCCRCTNSIRSNCGGIEKYTNTSMHKD